MSIGTGQRLRLASMDRLLLALLVATSLWPQPPRAESNTDAERCVSAITTKVSPTRDTYHGTVVADPYRWLEDWSDPAARSWSKAQSACARHYLDELPAAPKVRERLIQLLTVERGTSYTSPKYRTGRLFIIRRVPGAQQPSLVWFAQTDLSGTPNVVLDPMRFDPSGQTSIDWYVPSNDGERVAVSLSSGARKAGRCGFSMRPVANRSMTRPSKT